MRDPSSRINLMHVVLDMDIGGLQRLITQMTLAMDPQRYHVEVVCLNRGGCFADELISKGIEVTVLQKSQVRADLFYPVRLARFLRKKNVHVLQMHTGVFIFGALAGTLAFTPASVYTDHGRAIVDDPVRQAEDRIAVRLCDKIVAVSANLYDMLIERIHAPKRKLVTIINGIATDLFAQRPRPDYLVREFRIPADCKVIGTVARLDGVKDQRTMILAFEAIRKRIGESRLLLVGDGPLRDELTAFIQERNLDGQVIITGQRDDVPNFLNLFDTFVLSSLSEGTSISLLEAMASGVPPVVTRVGGNPDIVQDGVDGLVVEPGDPVALGAALEKVLTDRALHQAFASRSMAKVRRDYSIARMVQEYDRMYLDLLHRKKKFRNINV